MTLGAFIVLLVIVSTSANSNLSLKLLAANAQCEATCLMCWEDIGFPAEIDSCDTFCNDSTQCSENCKCVQNLLLSYDTEANIPRSPIEGQLSQPELNCREVVILSFSWESPHGFWPVYVTEFRQNGRSSWKPHSKTKETVQSIEGLSSNTQYQFRVRAMLRDGQFGPAVSSQWTSTLNDSFTPGKVEYITVDNMTLINESLNALVSWIPSWDRTCFYELLFWNLMIESPPILFNIKERLQFELQNLEFEQSYYVAVRATSRDFLRQSDKEELYFTTPSCLEVLANPAECPPPIPQRLEVHEKEASTPGLYDVEVTWDTPNVLPDHYLVSLISIVPAPEEEGGFNLTRNVSGSATQTVFTAVDLIFQYQVSIVAVSLNGHHSAAAVEQREIIAVPDESDSSSFALAMTLSLTLVVLAASLAMGFAYRRHNKRLLLERQRQYIEQMEEVKNETLEDSRNIDDKEKDISDYCDPAWEIPRDTLLMGNILGSGAFGIVRRGTMKKEDGTWLDVAIKMLSDDYTMEDVRHFRKEINMMQNVGHHPHIVSLIGCCTVEGKLQLIVEYCALGDLQNYLRKKWTEMNEAGECSKSEAQVKYADLLLESSDDEAAGSCNNFPANNGRARDKKQKRLTSTDLLSIARQIAIGMEYLACCRVIHRDLAARNVLLASEYTVKISDFGLSRDVYQQNIYRKKDNGLLPVKWMALESLLHQVYTTQSDVWSFGVLLWEIATMGGSPYPGVSANKLFNFLKQGHRMEKPPNCSQELYDIMSSCWRVKPTDRPTFVQLHQRLDSLLETSNPQKYLSLNLLTTASSSESCLRSSDQLSAMKYKRITLTSEQNTDASQMLAN